MNVISVLYTLLLFTVRPFKEHTELIQAIFNEVCLMMASMCAMALASMEKFGIVDVEVKMNIGWAIVFSNYLLIFVFLIRVFFVLEPLQGFWRLARNTISGSPHTGRRQPIR